MKHPIIRALDLEFALVTNIKNEGSQKLINALDDCKIRVEVYGDWTYAVMTFPGHYDEKATQNLCLEVESIGSSLGICPCDYESANPSANPDVVSILFDPETTQLLFEKIQGLGKDGSELEKGDDS